MFQTHMAENDLNTRKMSQSMYSRANNSSYQKKQKEPGSKGNFVRIEGAKFDIILNILIGIRRSLSTLVRLPGVELSEWQFKKSMMSESDWVDQGM